MGSEQLAFFILSPEAIPGEYRIESFRQDGIVIFWIMEKSAACRLPLEKVDTDLNYHTLHYKEVVRLTPLLKYRSQSIAAFKPLSLAW